MQTASHFRGTGVALITPFRSDGSIDVNSLATLTDDVITQGVDYLVMLGTTSESPVLDEAERLLVVNTIKEANNGRLPLVIGIGGNDTSFLLDRISHTDFTGIDAILSVAPYYNKPTQRGLYAHFDTIAARSPVPIILYNVPGRTSSNLSAETTLRLANAHSNIIAIKEASGNLDQIMHIIAHKPPHFELISGDDALTFPMICLGATGVISVAANAFPKEFSTMVRQTLADETALALKLHYRMLPLIDLLFVEGNPAGVKAFLSEKGMCQNQLRLPLVSVSDTTLQAIKKAWQQFNTN
ncbi:MAG: 4-hydroxy-tetrahydrodipicolinate synthase [Bacteroidales bacterium]|jgi:4-hydroxy-tetrahydrodipicolinate synthase|nr:4-hydroxy-tetrahydrodipicolinate synthase [Bacteroidales bacterium]MDD3701713.1 4-hydroxy-tetrahydrodipicolinate synthase [Bacteroidales bacterium]